MRIGNSYQVSYQYMPLFRVWGELGALRRRACSIWRLLKSRLNRRRHSVSQVLPSVKLLCCRGSLIWEYRCGVGQLIHALVCCQWEPGALPGDWGWVLHQWQEDGLRWLVPGRSKGGSGLCSVAQYKLVLYLSFPFTQCWIIKIVCKLRYTEVQD